MDVNKFEQAMYLIANGDTAAVASLFKKPGGRKFLESVVAMLLANAPGEIEDKEDAMRLFIHGMNKVEKRIKRQKEGEDILRQLL